MLKEKESDIQLAICQYLELRGYFFWRSNNIPAFEQKTGFYRPLPKYAIRGVADIILINKGKFIGLEVKTKKGKLSKNQEAFKELCEVNRGKYFVVRSVDDVEKLIKENALE